MHFMFMDLECYSECQMAEEKSRGVIHKGRLHRGVMEGMNQCGQKWTMGREALASVDVHNVYQCTVLSDKNSDKVTS